jgi:tetratricopeptide (TPR) repeat protein
LLVREEVYNVQGAREAQRQDLATLERLAEMLQDDQRRAEVAVRQARYAVMVTDYAAAIAAAQAAVGFGRVAQDVVSQAKAHLHWGRAFWRQDKFDAAERQFEQVLVLARAASLLREEAYSLRQLGLLYQGDYAKCRDYHECALRLFRQIGDRRGEGMSLRDIGWVLLYQDLTAARTYLEQSLRVCCETGDRRDEAWALMALGTCYRDQGDLLKARDCFDQALPLMHETDPMGESSVFRWASAVYFRLGDYATAKDCLERALRVDRTISNAEAAHCLASLGFVSHYQDDNEAAWEYSQQALRILESDDTPSIIAWCVVGHALANIGYLAEAADAYWRMTITLDWQTYGPRYTAEYLTGLARLSTAQGDLAGALAHVEELLCNIEFAPLAPRTADPFLVYLTCYRVLRANEDPRAGEVLRTAHRLLQEWAAKIDDEKWRRSFLENVPAHREIVEEWERLASEGHDRL